MKITNCSSVCTTTGIGFVNVNIIITYYIYHSFNLKLNLISNKTSDSYLCISGSKLFLLNSTMGILKDACKNNDMEMKESQNLLGQDYDTIGNCVPPEQRTNAIRLTYDFSNKCAGNNTYPYFWGSSQKVSGCVNDKPLDLPTNFEEKNRCHLAVIMPGSSNNIFTTAWMRCNATKLYICQLQTTIHSVTNCNITTPPTALTTTTTSRIIGSVLGVCGLLFILLLSYHFYKTSKFRSNSSKRTHQKIPFR